MRDPIVAVPADQPDALSYADSKTDIENMGCGACLKTDNTVQYVMLNLFQHLIK
jgi:hypothetical protein